MSKRGFTLIEVIMIVVLISLLGVVAVPRYFDLRDKARRAAEEGTVAAVRSGITTYQAYSRASSRTPVYPLVLDNASNAAASPTNVFFNNVVDNATDLDTNWMKLGSTLYQSPLLHTYVYNPSSGAFLLGSSGGSVAANGQPTSLVPSVTGTYNTSNYAVSDGGVYSPWAGSPVSFPLTFDGPGTYTFQVFAMNNANHSAFTQSLGQPERTNWTLPAGYTKFNVSGAIDGVTVSPAGFGVAASDTQFNSSTFTATVSSAGSHTLSLTWLNDQWDPANQGDANIQLQNVVVQRQ